LGGPFIPKDLAQGQLWKNGQRHFVEIWPPARLTQFPQVLRSLKYKKDGSAEFAGIFQWIHANCIISKETASKTRQENSRNAFFIFDIYKKFT